MAFDPSSATLVEEPLASAFDPSSATAVEEAPSAPTNPAAYLEDKVLTGLGVGPGGKQILKNAEDAAGDVISGFIPRSGSQLAGLVTPLVTAKEDIGRGYSTLKDMLFSPDKSAEEIARANYPEAFTLKDAESTPAFSKERFKAGFGVLANMAMAAGGVRGLTERPTLREQLLPPADGSYETPTGRVTLETNRPNGGRTAEATIFDPASAVPVAESPGEPQTSNAQRPTPNVQVREEAPVRTPEQVAATERAIESSTVTPVEDAAPAATVPKPRVFRAPSDAFGSEVTPVAAAVMEDGLMSKSTAKKNGMYAKNPDLWDDAPLLDHPTHGKIYSREKVEIRDSKGNGTGKFKTVGRGGVLPDVAAQNLYDAGLISEPAVGAMWDALKRESRTARTMAREERAFSKAEAVAHAEWQDQVKAGTHDPGVALMGPDGEPALITKAENGEGVELALLDKQGNPAVSLPHDTLDDALKSAHEQGFRLDDGSQSGKVIFDDETASPASNGDAAAPGETAGAPPETTGAEPKLRAGEKQGDLLATQTEDLTLVGEKGVDHGARAAEAVAAEQARAEGQAASDAAQTDIFDKHDWTGATEPIEHHAGRLKLKAKNAEGGFINADVLKDVAEFGARIARKGLEFAKWSAEMIKHLGEAIKPHLKTVWDSLTGQNTFKRARESGAVGGVGIRKRSGLDEATGERSARLQQSFADAERASKEIRKVAPSERRQGAISVWMEANGDAAKLAGWESAAKGKVFKQAADDAQRLSPAELAIAQKAQGAFKVLEQRGNTYDVLGNHRDNYVPHVWDVDKKGTGIGSSKLQDQFKFNKARTFENFFEGDQAGFTPKTLAIGKLLPSYLHEMNKVIADRQFVQDLQGETASDGSPLVIPRGRVSSIETDAGGKAYLVNPDAIKTAKDKAGNPIDQSKYKVVDQPALHDWRWEGKDADGNPIYMKDDLAVHPDVAKRLNAMNGQSGIRQWYNEPSTGLSTIPKAIAKGLDTAQSVMKREMFGLLAPFHQVQEGWHGVGHLTNPVATFDLSKPTAAQADAMKHGLMLLPDRASAGGFMEGVGGKGTFLTQAARWLGEKAGDNLIGKGARGIAAVVDGYQSYLFHNYIPGLKFATYEHALARNMERYAKDIAAGKVTESDVKLLSAQQMNAAYGHLNLALLDRNPTMQHIMQLTLLAPDFLEARGRFVGQAAKSLIGEKAGHEQLRAIATLAAVQAGIAYVVSKSLGDDWDPKHPFEVVHNGKSYMLRSVPEDIHRLLFQGPDVRREFMSARINPTLQKADQLRTGLNYRGEKTGAIDTLEELLANYIPITARSIPGVRELTATSKNNPLSPLEQLAGSAGLKISRASAITQTHQIATQWMDAQKIEHGLGSYPVSKFTPLRYALEDGDMDRAQTEWEKLKGKEGADEKKLREGFSASIKHPFTGTKARDEEFENSLEGRDRLIYERALEVRSGILDKFNSL